METSLPPLLLTRIRTYLLLTKPGIIMGNALTGIGGFFLASKEGISLPLLLATLLGLSLVIASACVFNNYLDQEIDRKMKRTQNRPLALGLISSQTAVLFGAVLGVLGASILYIGTNPLTTLLSLLGFFIYVVLYSTIKYRSSHATLIGSVAGAIPPAAGYTAVTNNFDLAALLLFLLIALWQMPHFFAIALYRLEDYKKAGIPVLPLKKGILATKVQMLLYLLGFIATATLLTVLHYTGYLFLLVVGSLGLYWLFLGLKGFKCSNEKLWARKMFLFSLVIVLSICLLMPFNIA